MKEIEEIMITEFKKRKFDSLTFFLIELRKLCEKIIEKEKEGEMLTPSSI